MKYHLLNTVATTALTESPVHVADTLKQAVNLLKGHFYDLETGTVNYQAMKGSEAFAEYKQKAAALQGFELSSLASQAEKLAFWINIYNALTTHGIVALDVKNSIKEIGLNTFFGTVAYQIGPYSFSLDDIEHGILRRNQKKHWLARRPFGGHDPRLAWMVESLEPRIHFALVCGSQSCPPIGVYQAEQIDTQLTLAAENFINSTSVRLDREKNHLYVSKILDWYGKDFGSKEELLSFITQYMKDEDDKQYLNVNKNKISFYYQEYNWNLNI